MADRKITDLAELTSPVAADLLPIVVAAEPSAANKNKKIQYGTFLRNIPSGTVGAPSIAWTADTGVTGFYRSAANEIAFTTNSTFQGKFTTQGLQLGTGTGAAQLHLFSADTTDQVIIENTDAGLDTAPDVVLYRNSASPANNDNLGNLEFRGKDSAGNDQTYAQILSSISTVTNTSEVGILDLMTADAGVSAMRLRLKGTNVGISEANPIYPLHVSNTVSSTTLQLQCTLNDASSGADITMYRRRGATTVGQNSDLLSTIYWRGHNDNATTEQVDYAAITGSIVDITNNAEDGKLELKVQADGTLTTEVAITAANTTLSGRPIIPTHTPASPTATAITGEIAWDNGYLYVATATDTWKKVGISTSGTPGSTAAFSSGSAAAPSITFADDTNTGAFNPAADAFAIATDGTERLRVDSTGQIEAVSLGTAGAPTYTFFSDPDTGVYSPGANQVAISTGGSGRLFVNSAGQVGIGKTPVQLLDGESSGNVQFRVTTTDTSGSTIAQLVSRYTGGGGGTASTAILRAGDGYTALGASTSSPVVFITNETERLRITSAGLVGIGTSSPIALFHAAGAGVFRATAVGISATLATESSAFSVINGTTYNGSPSASITIGASNYDAVNTSAPFQWKITTPAASAAAGARFTISSRANDATVSGVETPRLTILGSGNVGIGTTSPAHQLDVVNESGDSIIRARSGSGASLMRLRGSSAALAAYNAVISNDNVDGVHWYLGGDGNQNTLVVKTNNTERARIDSSGRLLVGTSTASTTLSALTAKMQVQGTNVFDTGITNALWESSENPAQLQLVKSRGASIGTHTVVQNGDNLGRILFGGSDGTDFETAAWIQCQVDGTPGTNDMPGRLVFMTTADGASSPTEALRITNDQVICYNQPTPTSKSAAATLTVAELKTRIIEYTGSAATLTLPTGTLTEGGFSGIYTNMTFEYSVINTGSGTCTIGAGTGHTIVGAATIASGASGRFAARRTASNTFVSYRLS